MTLYLVDNSVLQRVARAPAVVGALEALNGRGDVLALCALSLDEAGFSARSAAEMANHHQQYRKLFGFLALREVVDALSHDIRSALFAYGMGRAAGVVDVHIAAVAVSHDATVLHYDSDFEQISSAYPHLRQEWAVPRGSVE